MIEIENMINILIDIKEVVTVNQKKINMVKNLKNQTQNITQKKELKVLSKN